MVSPAEIASAAFWFVARYAHSIYTSGTLAECGGFAPPMAAKPQPLSKRGPHLIRIHSKVGAPPQNRTAPFRVSDGRSSLESFQGKMVVPLRRARRPCANQAQMLLLHYGTDMAEWCGPAPQTVTGSAGIQSRRDASSLTTPLKLAPNARIERALDA